MSLVYTEGVRLVEQTNLYEFLGLSNDPLFNQIERLGEGEEIRIDSFNIRKTNKFYEVENDEIHEGFKTLSKCYSFICSNL